MKKHDLNDIARGVLLYWCQSWGQTIQERVEALNKAITYADINAKFVQYKNNEEKWIAGWETNDDKMAEKAKNMRREIDRAFRMGDNFEWEVNAIKKIISRYKRDNDIKPKAINILMSFIDKLKKQIKE